VLLKRWKERNEVRGKKFEDGWEETREKGGKAGSTRSLSGALLAVVAAKPSSSESLRSLESSAERDDRRRNGFSCIDEREKENEGVSTA